MAALDRAETRFTVSEMWRDERPQLFAEQWVRGPKKAKKLEVRYGSASYSIYSHAQMEQRALTPEEALEKYVVECRVGVTRLERELGRARAMLARAEHARIVDGKLVP
jgi:hypothetical protein